MFEERPEKLNMVRINVLVVENSNGRDYPSYGLSLDRAL